MKQTILGRVTLDSTLTIQNATFEDIEAEILESRTSEINMRNVTVKNIESNEKPVMLIS